MKTAVFQPTGFLLQCYIFPLYVFIKHYLKKGSIVSSNCAIQKKEAHPIVLAMGLPHLKLVCLALNYKKLIFAV